MKKFKIYSGLTFLLLILSACATDSDSNGTKEAAKKPAGQSTEPQPHSVNNNPARTAVASGPKVKTPKPEVNAVSFGRGIASNENLSITFMHKVSKYENGTADGEFKQSAMTEAGTIDIEAEVSCAAFDHEENKGWIGGTVKRNSSTNPAFAGPAGVDVWFRLLDLGAEKETALITVAQFKNDTIGSASEFCQEKPWPDNGLIELSDGALAIFP